MAETFILTASCNEAAQFFFESARCRYYPADRNIVPAHISLFHRLPGEECTAVKRHIQSALTQPADFRAEVLDPCSIGGGVAFYLKAPTLLSVHAALRARWLPWLSLQDQQGFRPHIVVQNKVAQHDIRQTLLELQQQVFPRELVITSFELWRYDDGPWTHLQTFATPHEVSSQRPTA